MSVMLNCANKSATEISTGAVLLIGIIANGTGVPDSALITVPLKLTSPLSNTVGTGESF